MLQTTGEQIKAARALLKMEQRELAKQVGCDRTRIFAVEKGDELPVKEKVVSVLVEAGIEFIRDGVRLRP